MLQDIEIASWNDLGQMPADTAAVEAIFFETSNTRSFASDDERQAFRERWLGRYLEHDPDLVFLALDRDQRVLGYVIGSTDDPAEAERFADIAFFKTWRDLTASYPAQLHINLTDGARGRGIGSLLINHFCEVVAKRSVPGVHAVTGAGLRNVGFYNRNGFIERGRIPGPRGDLCFLGRKL